MKPTINSKWVFKGDIHLEVIGFSETEKEWPKTFIELSVSSENRTTYFTGLQWERFVERKILLPE